MRKISLFRVDDRLVHGQIVTAWLQSSNCDTILVADDKAASDTFSKTLFKMAIPKGIKLEVLSVDDSVVYLNKDGDENIFLIVRSLETVWKLIELGLEFVEVNLGNISQSPDRKKYTKSIFLNSDDIELINKILDAGKYLYIQVVPNEKAIDVDKLLKT